MWSWIGQQCRRVVTSTFVKRPFITTTICGLFAGYYTFTQTKWKCLPIAYKWHKYEKTYFNRAVPNNQSEVTNQLLSDLVFFKENVPQIPKWIWKKQHWIKPIDVQNIDFTPHIRTALYYDNDVFLQQLIDYQFFKTFEYFDIEKLRFEFSFGDNDNALKTWIENGGDFALRHNRYPTVLLNPNILKLLFKKSVIQEHMWKDVDHTSKWISVAHHWPHVKKNFNKHEELIHDTHIIETIVNSHNKLDPKSIDFKPFLDDMLDNKIVTLQTLEELMPRLASKYYEPMDPRLISYVYEKKGDPTKHLDIHGQSCEFLIQKHIHFLHSYYLPSKYRKQWSDVLDKIREHKKEGELKNYCGKTPRQAAKEQSCSLNANLEPNI